MDVRDVVQRVLLRHAKLVLFIVVTAVVIVFALHQAQPSKHVATARISLAGGEAGRDTDSRSLADSAAAIVTSHDPVASALREAKVTRDVDSFARKNIALAAVGTSDVVELSVTDENPRVATTVANALARSLAEIRQRIGRQSLQPQIDNVDAQLAQTTRRINDLQLAVTTAGGRSGETVLRTELASAQSAQRELQGRYDTIAKAVARGKAPADSAVQLQGLKTQLASAVQEVAQIKASISRASRSEGEQLNLLQLQLDDQLQQQAVLRSDRQRLGESEASRVVPVVIEAATSAEVAQSTLGSTIVLAGLLGLVLGLVAASLLETVRPSVVGADALARVFGASVLGTLSGPPDSVDGREVVHLARCVSLAAGATGVHRVELVSVPGGPDLERLALRLGDHLVATPEVSALDLDKPEVGGLGDFGDGSEGYARNGVLGTPTGIVLVAPNVSQRRQLDSVTHLTAMTGWPLLGVVTYRSSNKARGGAQSAGRSNRTRPSVPAQPVVPTSR